MKRTFVIIIALLTILALAGCTQPVPEEGTQVHFYYITNNLNFGSEEPLLIRVNRNVSWEDNTPESIIRLYLNGPTSYDCVSPFPGGTELVEMYVESNRVSLVLSPHIGTLSPVDQTIAYACLTKTVIELTGVSTVQLRLENSLINGEETASFQADSFDYFDSMTQADLSE